MYLNNCKERLIYLYKDLLAYVEEIAIEMPICQGIVAKNGTKCEKQALKNGYCGYHKAQAVRESLGRPMCKGVVVKNGLKCTRSAYDNGYCGYHKTQANVVHVTPSKQTRAVTPSKQTRAVTPSKQTRAVTPSKQTRAVTPIKQTRAVAPRASTRNNTRPARAAAPMYNAVSRHGMICAAADEWTLLVLQELVGVYSTYDKIFIGKASSGNTPEKRWSQKYESLGYERMQVLCETPTVEGALWLETELIAHCKRVDGVNIQNPIAGGGGAKGKPPGYVYLVVG
jgi:hypothetical protein